MDDAHELIEITRKAQLAFGKAKDRWIRNINTNDKAVMAIVSFNS